jgi:hypothetical protein
MWSTGGISGEDSAPSMSIRRDGGGWWMVGLDTGPPLGDALCSRTVLKSLCVADCKCWVSSHHPILFHLWGLGRLGCTLYRSP